jgi:hypothetical protein
MINFQVENLDELLEQLKSEGVEVDPRVETYEYGRFGWIMDPEGNRIERWEPPEKKVSSEVDAAGGRCAVSAIMFETRRRVSLQILLADVFIPEVQIFGDEFLHHLNAFGQIEIDYFHTVSPHKVERAWKSAALADDELFYSELNNRACAQVTRH